MSLPAVTIRQAQLSDLRQIHDFILQKADFDRSMGATGELQMTKARLRATLFNQQPFAQVLLAELATSPIGFALYYFRYSSFMARPSLWLDDLFLVQSHRRQGIGKALMTDLAKIATHQQCTHMAWEASIQNINGIRFYRSLGAEIVEHKQRTTVFQLDISKLTYSSDQDLQEIKCCSADKRIEQ